LVSRAIHEEFEEYLEEECVATTSAGVNLSATIKLPEFERGELNCISSCPGRDAGFQEGGEAHLV